MSAAQTLSLNTLHAIQQRFSMRELHGAAGGAFRELSSPMGKVGELRIFAGDAVRKMVYISMSVPQFGLDSHMIFAFTAPESAVPHFTLDSVMNAPDFAFHLDLIPRVDLGANVEYIKSVFNPLNSAFEDAGKIEGLRPARLGATQYAIMSPWMLAFRADAQAFDAIQTPVTQYLEHWFGLVENGVHTADSYDPSALAVRDQRNRDAIFNPEIDRVWAQVDRLLGADTSAFLRDVLRNQAVEAVPA
jgi:hypothetical protein